MIRSREIARMNDPGVGVLEPSNYRLKLLSIHSPVLVAGLDYHWAPTLHATSRLGNLVTINYLEMQ